MKKKTYKLELTEEETTRVIAALNMKHAEMLGYADSADTDGKRRMFEKAADLWIGLRDKIMYQAFGTFSDRFEP